MVESVTVVNFPVDFLDIEFHVIVRLIWLWLLGAELIFSYVGATHPLVLIHATDELSACES